MTSDEVERTYAVGRGKPPAHTQFKPGQSGNLKGRPRGSVGFQQALIAAGNEKVVVTEKGRKIRLSKVEIAALQLANKAAAGDYRGIELLVKHLGSTITAEPSAAPPADKADVNLGTDEDMQVLEAFMERVRKEGSS